MACVEVPGEFGDSFRRGLVRFVGRFWAAPQSTGARTSVRQARLFLAHAAHQPQSERKRRETPFWEREVYVGKVNEFILKGVSIDETRFGVKAISADGGESLVAAYAYPPRQKVEYQTVE